MEGNRPEPNRGLDSKYFNPWHNSEMLESDLTDVVDFIGQMTDEGIKVLFEDARSPENMAEDELDMHIRQHLEEGGTLFDWSDEELDSEMPHALWMAVKRRIRKAVIEAAAAAFIRGFLDGEERYTADIFREALGSNGYSQYPNGCYMKEENSFQISTSFK